MAATTEHVLTPVPQVNARAVQAERTGWTSWVTTTDHKKIGIMYMVLTFIFFLLGGIAALLVRVQLALPESPPFSPARLFSMPRAARAHRLPPGRRG